MTSAILLVEDEENDVFFMQEALKKTGVMNPIRVASDGQQAIDCFNVAAKSIKDFWLTQNTTPPESHEKEAATGLTYGSRREASGRVRQSTLETFSFLDNAQQSLGNINL